MKLSLTRSAGALALLLIPACQARDTNETKPSAPESAAAKPTPTPSPLPTPSPGAPEARPVEVPTEEDFEEEASHKITGRNLEEELDRLEKELEGK